MYEEVFETEEGFALVEVAEHVIELPRASVIVGKVTHFDGLGREVSFAVHLVEVKGE